jgi:hypothetical protein
MSRSLSNRREKRIAAVFPIRLWGMDANGRPFIEASKTINVSRSGVRCDVPTKLGVGDVIGHRFRVVWIGTAGTSDAGSIGLQSLESREWIWEELNLPAEDVDIYSRPPESERRLVNRVRCFLSAEVVCVGAGQKALAFVRDLSLCGCYVAMTFPFPVESNVSIGLCLNDQTKIWVDGIVISSHPSTGMGMKFLGISRLNLIALEDCLKELSHSVQLCLPEKAQSKALNPITTSSIVPRPPSPQPTSKPEISLE